MIILHFRARKEYWQNLKPASGRPHCAALSVPDQWGVTKVHVCRTVRIDFNVQFLSDCPLFLGRRRFDSNEGIDG